MKNYLFISSILLSLVNLGFFIYGFNKISIISNSVKSECRDYFKYNIGVLSSFAFSIFVTVSYICCSNCLATLMYIGNAIILGSLALDKYSRKDKICDYECEIKCNDLYTLGKNTEIFFITDLVIIGVTILVILGVIINKSFCCRNNVD